MRSICLGWAFQPPVRIWLVVLLLTFRRKHIFWWRSSASTLVSNLFLHCENGSMMARLPHVSCKWVAQARVCADFRGGTGSWFGRFSLWDHAARRAICGQQWCIGSLQKAERKVLVQESLVDGFKDLLIFDPKVGSWWDDPQLPPILWHFLGGFPGFPGFPFTRSQGSLSDPRGLRILCQPLGQGAPGRHDAMELPSQRSDGAGWPGPGGPGGRWSRAVFELLPLRPGERAKLGEVLRIVPWGPSIITVGKNRKCDLYVTDEMAGVSNSHAELQLMQSRAAGIRLFISDSSKNGTWVNEHRLPKGAMRELKDGDQLRLADVPRFALRKFESLQQCQRAPIPVDGPEFKVPPCPYFIKKVKSTPKQSKQSKQASHLSSLKDLKGASTNAWAEVPRVPDDDGTELWAEVPRLPEEDLPSSANDEPEPPVTRKRARRWKKGRETTRQRGWMD